jgi:hypothetical protein
MTPGVRPLRFGIIVGRTGPGRRHADQQDDRGGQQRRRGPIFELADVGVVGELVAVVPQLTDQITGRKG